MSGSSMTILGIAGIILFGAVIIALWRRYANAASVLLVAAIAAVAIVVTVFQIDHYRQRQAADADMAQSQPAGATGLTAPPPAPPPVIVQTPSPMMRGPTGGAAPPAARNPYGKS